MVDTTAWHGRLHPPQLQLDVGDAMDGDTSNEDAGHSTWERREF